MIFNMEHDIIESFACCVRQGFSSKNEVFIPSLCVYENNNNNNNKQRKIEKGV